MDFLCLCEFFDERKAGSNAFHEVSQKMMEKAFPVKWPFSHEWLGFKTLVQKPTNQILCNFIWSHVCFYECSSLFSFCFLQSHNIFWHSPEGVKGHKCALSFCAWLFGLLCWWNELMAHHVVHSLLHKTLVVSHCGDESMCHTYCVSAHCLFTMSLLLFEPCDGPKQSQTKRGSAFCWEGHSTASHSVFSSLTNNTFGTSWKASSITSCEVLTWSTKSWHAHISSMFSLCVAFLLQGLHVVTENKVAWHPGTLFWHNCHQRQSLGQREKWIWHESTKESLIWQLLDCSSKERLAGGSGVMLWSSDIPW